MVRNWNTPRMNYFRSVRQMPLNALMLMNVGTLRIAVVKFGQARSRSSLALSIKMPG